MNSIYKDIKWDILDTYKFSVSDKCYQGNANYNACFDIIHDKSDTVKIGYTKIKQKQAKHSAGIRIKIDHA